MSPWKEGEKGSESNIDEMLQIKGIIWPLWNTHGKMEIFNHNWIILYREGEEFAGEKKRNDDFFLSSFSLL